MKTMVMGPRMTVPITEKPGYRILATEFNRETERIQLLIRLAGRFSHYPFPFFRLCRLVSRCHKTGSAVTASSFSERRLSQGLQLAHSRDVTTAFHGVADYNSPSTNTIDHALLSHTTFTKPESLQRDSN